MRTTQILMNKTVYLDLSILNLCKTAMCGFWHYYVKPKYGENAKLGCNGHRQLHCSCKKGRYCEICWKRFDTSNSELGRPLPRGKNIKVIGLMKDELGRQVMKEFVGLIKIIAI